IAGARVSLWPIPTRYTAGLQEAQGKERAGPAATAVSDAEGYFVLTAPTPGLWEVVAEASGFVSIRRSALPVLEDINLPEGEMPADAGCRVKVWGPDGRPADGAQVRGEARPDDSGRTNGWEPAERRAVTGSSGGARLPSAKSESLLLHAFVPGLPAWSGMELEGCE